MRPGLFLAATVAGIVPLLTAGCEAINAVGDDFSRVLSSQPTAGQARRTPSPRPPPPAPPPRAPAPAPVVRTVPASSQPALSPEVPPANDVAVAAPLPAPPPAEASLAGRSEDDIRRLLGAPATEEDQAPGKRWVYRDGACSLAMQFYPDVQTKRFALLAYDVRSDDNTSEGKRACMARFQSRIAGRP